jgi:calcium-dependent protein kinase
VYQKFSEGDAANCMQNIFKGLNYMHAKQIIHRDIKLENVLLESKNNIRQAKITDFGFSTKCEDLNFFKDYGTPGFIAPEILLDKDYGCKADIFSAGVILF